MSGNPETLRIVLVDDHVAVRQGLKLVIEAHPGMQVVGEASDGADALEQVRTLTPDVVVMDISMPGMNGLVTTRALRERYPGTGVVILTRHGDDAYLQELLRAGASGYVLKQSAATELIQAIRAIGNGGQYLDASLTARVTADFVGRHIRGNSRGAVTLSDRESEVLRLIASGYGNKEIAGQLDLSVKTVEVHKANAMRKLGFKGRIDIVRYAVLQGWLHDT